MMGGKGGKKKQEMRRERKWLKGLVPATAKKFPCYRSRSLKLDPCRMSRLYLISRYSAPSPIFEALYLNVLVHLQIGMSYLTVHLLVRNTGKRSSPQNMGPNRTLPLYPLQSSLVLVSFVYTLHYVHYAGNDTPSISFLYAVEAGKGSKGFHNSFVLRNNMKFQSASSFGSGYLSWTSRQALWHLSSRFSQHWSPSWPHMR